MQLSRLACGIVAGSVGILAGVQALAVETRFFGGSAPRTFWAVFFGVGGGTFWLADWLGLVSTPFTPPPLDLSGREDVASQAPKAG